MTNPADDEDLPPLDRALAQLGDRVEVRKNGEYRLDGIPARVPEIIAAANRYRAWHVMPLIPYPGVTPPPERKPQPQPEARDPSKPIRVGRWTFFSSPEVRDSVVYPPWEELEELTTRLNRLVADNTPENWDAANEWLDLTFKKVCQFMRDRTPQRIEQPDAPAKEESA